MKSPPPRAGQAPSFHSLSPWRKSCFTIAITFYLFAALLMSQPPKDKAASPFPTTSWSLVQRVQEGTEADALRALEEICRLYWYPIYAYARRSGFGPHDAEDLAQVFFQQMIARETMQAVRQEKGRLRTFMLTLLMQVISRQIRHDRAEKRGGGHEVVSLDELNAEDRYAHEPAHEADPARLFDRAWAGRMLERAESRLREDYEKARNAATFDVLRPFLPSSTGEASYPEIAARLGIREGAVRLQVHRMRKRFAELIDDEIAQTVTNPAELEVERNYLIGLVGAG